MLKNGLITGIILLALSFLLTFGLDAIWPSYAREFQTAMFRPWNDPLMMAFFFYPFILGFVSYYLWTMLSKQFKGAWIKRAFEFAKIYFIIATIPGMFITLTTFNISFLMVGVWTVTGFVEAFIAGLVFEKLK